MTIQFYIPLWAVKMAKEKAPLDPASVKLLEAIANGTLAVEGASKKALQ
jgi:hypothetical protein